MEVLAIIPARGGSKGIPRKNIRPLAGVPLVGWVIRAAQAAQRITRVVVSTDDDEIATYAAGLDAGVIARPPELATDEAATIDALRHALGVLETEESYRPSVVLCVQPTSPMLTAANLDAVAAACVDPFRSVIAVWEDHPFRWLVGANGCGIPFGHDARTRTRRQDLDPTYSEGAGVYAWPARELGRDFLPHPTGLVEVGRGIDIDDEADWCMAEALLLRRAGT